ncbi:MAG: hypothetical protein ACRDZ8_08740 [Acidimicrobiales bacterium]
MASILVAAAVGAAGNGATAARTIGDAATVGLESATPDHTATTTSPTQARAATVVSPSTSAPSVTGVPTAPRAETRSAGAPPTSSTVPTPASTTTTTTVPVFTAPPAPVVPVPPTTPPTTSFNPDPNPTQNADGTWGVVSNGISITLQVEPQSPTVGETVHFVMTATAAMSQCCITTFYPGDGSITGPFVHGPILCPTASPSTFSQETDHIYTEPGTFSVEVQPSILAICGNRSPTPVNATMFVRLTVTPAAQSTT